MAVKGGSALVANDIVDVKLLTNKRQSSSSNRTAIVTFSSFTKKLNFVTKRKVIKNETCYKDVSISDLLPKASQQLYTHALTLRNVGFCAVYHQNGIIYAKKSMEGVPIAIRGMDHVDSLMKKSALTNRTQITPEDEDITSEEESG
ncbi:hypothetical protein ACFFRR_003198 [Megaselia abdita]